MKPTCIRSVLFFIVGRHNLKRNKKYQDVLDDAPFKDEASICIRKLSYIEGVCTARKY